ncbi:MAG: hypothetical protein WC648_04750 [Candidatus Paceibacterota bacterium]|jgi:hypothetical protein
MQRIIGTLIGIRTWRAQNGQFFDILEEGKDKISPLKFYSFGLLSFAVGSKIIAEYDDIPMGDLKNSVKITSMIHADQKNLEEIAREKRDKENGIVQSFAPPVLTAEQQKEVDENMKNFAPDTIPSASIISIVEEMSKIRKENAELKELLEFQRAELSRINTDIQSLKAKTSQWYLYASCEMTNAGILCGGALQKSNGKIKCTMCGAQYGDA